MARSTGSVRRLGVRLCVLVSLCAGCREATPGEPPPAAPLPVERVQLNQGWSDRESAFYNHANEGTNLAPLDFLLHLPDPRTEGGRFVTRLTADYGFIEDPVSPANPHGLPVGFTVDERPTQFGDRVYVGLTCAACHTRQMAFTRTDVAGESRRWVIPVHGGPGLVDIPRFTRDLYDAFFALRSDDTLARVFAEGVLGHAPSADEIAALRAEVSEFTEPVAVTRAVLDKAGIARPDFGPGNLNALSQGYYNNIGLAAWLTQKGILKPNNDPRPFPKFEGSVNLPPMWFAHGDTWAQWFAEIHDPGPRNWVQSASTSEIRPPKMVAALRERVMLASIHFDNITEVQRLLELLRTPKWPEPVFGALDRGRIARGEQLYAEQCARCHTRTVLPPNDLGFVFKERPAFDVGTDPTAYQQFADGADVRAAGLKQMADRIAAMRQAQLLARKLSPQEVANYMKFHSKGRPNVFGIAADGYRDSPDASWPKSGAAYWASPLEGIFATSPYFHNGSVRTLREVLTAPDQRARTFRTGSVEFDADGVGLRDEGSFVYDTSEPGKGNGGHAFGTDLPQADKDALLEYLKSL